MKYIISLFFLVRPLNIITAIASVFIVYYMVDIDNLKLIISPCIILACYMAAGNILNDLIDIESDKINKPNRPLINNSINTYLLIIIIIILFFIGAWFAMNIDVYAMRIALFFALPGIISYELIFKRIPLIGNILISSLVGIVFVFTELALSHSASITWKVTLLAFSLNLIREIIKDIEDIQGDLQLNYRSLPIVAGLPTTILVVRFISIAFIVISMLPIFTLYYSWYYIPLIIFLIHTPLLYITIGLRDDITPKECAKYSKVLKLMIINGIVIILLSAK